MATTAHSSFPGARLVTRTGVQPSVKIHAGDLEDRRTPTTLSSAMSPISAQPGSGIQVTGKGSNILNVAAFGTSQRTTGSA